MIDAIVLAICPGRRTAFAVVHGDRVYEAGSWDLLREVKTTGPRATPAVVLQRMMERDLQSIVEDEALRWECDAVAIEREPEEQFGVAIEGLLGAVRCGSFRAKTTWVDADRHWLDRPTARLDDLGRSDADRLVSTMRARSGCNDVDPQLERTLRLGLHASRYMGVPHLPAMPDLGE